jgi:hypothetical protein
MFWQTASIEQYKIFKRSVLWVELGLLTLAIGAMSVFIYSASRTAGSSVGLSQGASTALTRLVTWPGALLNSLNIAAGNNVGGMMIIILVGAVAAQEYRWRTVSLW